MKAIKKSFFIAMVLIALSLGTQAQENPPHPPTHDNIGDASAPAGGGAPIGGGSLLLLLMSGGYAIAKWRKVPA